MPLESATERLRVLERDDEIEQIYIGPCTPKQMARSLFQSRIHRPRFMRIKTGTGRDVSIAVVSATALYYTSREDDQPHLPTAHRDFCDYLLSGWLLDYDADRSVPTIIAVEMKLDVDMAGLGELYYFWPRTTGQ